MIDVTQNVGRQWGWVALRGLVAVLFGLLALFLPGITLAALVLVWGAYALVDGVFALIAGWRIRDQDKPLWPLVLVGITGLAAGIVTFLWPGVTAWCCSISSRSGPSWPACSRSSRPSVSARKSRTNGCTGCPA